MQITLPKSNDEGKSVFSYTQYSKWKKSKKEYIRNYIFGERFEGNAYTEFGTMVGEALEHNDYSAFDKAETAVLKKVTRLHEFERKIDWDLGDFNMIGFIDTNDLIKKKIVKTIVDYKTGDMNKVVVYEDDSYDQITIYAGAIEQETGTLPEHGWVELIERTGNAYKGEELMLGKKIARIPQDISKKNVEKTKKSIIKVAKEVSTHYQVFNILNKVMV